MSYQKHNFEAGAVLFASQLNDMDNQIEFLSNQGSSFSDDFKEALLNCFRNVAWSNEDGQIYYDVLYDILRPDEMWSITNTLIGCTTSNNATNILKNNSYVATITAIQGYTLNGATVSILMGGNDVTNLYYSSGSINIPNVTGNLVITVNAISDISSISAVFSTGVSTPIDISSSTVFNAWISNDGVWASSDSSASICVPVTTGKRYSFDWVESDSSTVGSIFNIGFSNTNTPINQTLTNFLKISPATSNPISSVVADRPYLVIQLGFNYINSILSNGYLVITELPDKIYAGGNLDSLRQYLTVTATFADSSTSTISDYLLSGELLEGNNTITVSYGGKFDTFTVSCVIRGWLYRFDQSINSSGSEDFGFYSSHVEYTTGVDGVGYAYNRISDATAAPGESWSASIKALGPAYVPNFSGDFTFSAWAKTTNNSIPVFTAYKSLSSASTANVTNAVSTPSYLASGWTNNAGNMSARYKGSRLQTTSGNFNVSLFAKDNTNRATINLVPPSSFVYTQWHHYAVTRNNGVVRFFIDGIIICSFNYTKAIYFAPQISIGGAFSDDVDNNSEVIRYTNTVSIDDFYISEFCKWNEPFDPTTIVY